MPKPDLPEPLATLEVQIIEALLDGHLQWRRDIPFPESYSDMQGAVRGLLKGFAVLDLGGSSELRLRVGTLLQLHWKTLTNAQLDAIKAICDKAGESAEAKPPKDPRIENARTLRPAVLAALCVDLKRLEEDMPEDEIRAQLVAAIAALVALGEGR